MLSFMWGSGRPAMYSHDQLNEITHERLADLCGGVGMNYYRHIHKMADAGHVVTYDPAAHPELPEDYLERAGSVTTPILFLAGEDNKVFTDSNVECHRLLNEVAPGRNDLVRLPGYGHADPFLGKNAARDVFPHILAFLDEHRQKQRTTMTGGIS
jgi:cholesterol oxidase